MNKAISIALTLAMAMSMAVSAMACDQDEADILPHGALCDECGKGEMVLYSTDSSDWAFTGYDLCQHGYTDHRDEYYERQVTRTYRCTNCGIKDVSSQHEEKLVCPEW